MFYFGLDSLLHCLRICEGCEGSLLKCEWDYDHARKSWIIRYHPAIAELKDNNGCIESRWGKTLRIIVN